MATCSGPSLQSALLAINRDDEQTSVTATTSEEQIEAAHEFDVDVAYESVAVIAEKSSSEANASQLTKYDC